jgi:hypothetical protein
MPTLRSIYKFLVPSWLSAGDGGKVLDVQTGQIDDSVEKMRESLVARFPTYAQDDALTLIGQDRLIPRGRTEEAAHYAQRLIGWRYPRGHRVRGSAFALLNQVSEYFGGVYCWTIDAKGNRHEHAADGTESYSYGYAWDWDSGADPRLGLFWLVIDLQGIARPNPLIGDPALWGNTVGPVGRGYAIGHTGVTHDDAVAIRNLLSGTAQWKPAGTLGVMAVITLDGSTPVPPGTWGTWIGRDLDYRYWSLAP